MNLSSLADPTSALLVVGGTALATLLRCGPRDCVLAVRGALSRPRRRFDSQRVRAELARQLQDIQLDGFLRANPHLFGDSEFDDATGAMIEARSVDALLARHEVHRAARADAAERAAATFAQGAELAPVFGLAGTLISLSQLPASGLQASAFAGSISMAVLTTLYGLLLANLLLAPVSRAIERSHAREEQERQSLIDWIAGELRPSSPPALVDAA